MNATYFILKRFSLFSALIFAVAGCGSSSSSSSTANNETGSIAAKLLWSSAESKESSKTLYAFPTGVTSIKIYVQDSSNVNLLPFPGYQEFTDPTASSGTITGIPVGNGRKIRVEGLGPHGSQAGTFLTYLGTKTVNIVAGTTPTPVTITMEAPVTSASPASKSFSERFEVTLTASVPATVYYTTNEPVTIYYTTNGSPPIYNENIATSSVKKIWIEPEWVAVDSKITLQYFARVQSLYEAIKSQVYTRTSP